MQATILNVLGKIPQKQETLEEVNAAISGAIKQAQEVHRLNDAKKADAGWGQEYEELSRRFPMETVDEAEANVAALKSSIAAFVKECKAKISECRGQLKTPYLSRLEQTHVEQKAEALGRELEDFKKHAEMRLRFAEGRLSTVREFDHLRGRWQELKARAAAIARALQA
jgi:hypothetical protein